MKSASLFFTIGFIITVTVTISKAAFENRIRRSAYRELALQKPNNLPNYLAKPQTQRKLMNMSQSKLTRLVNALKSIRKNRRKNRKQKNKGHQTRKVAKKHQNHVKKRRHLVSDNEADQNAIDLSVNTATTDESSNIISRTINYLNDTSTNVGEFAGYIPHKMGMDFSQDGDYLATGLGTIGFSYGLYDYYSRKKDTKTILEILEDRYRVGGLHNAALEEENSNLVFINKKLIYTKGKIDRTKKQIEARVHELDSPLFN